MVTTLVLLALLGADSTPSKGDVTHARRMVFARMESAERIASDPAIIAAAVAKNKQGETLDAIKATDAKWIADPSLPLRKELTSNACAKRLRELVGTDKFIVEAFLMDANGALVCATNETSDYWQGDEAKYQKTYGANAKVFIDTPSFDESANVFAVQFTLLVKQGDRKAGAVTLTMRLQHD